ncbi:ribosomal protein S5 domain 2-type protein [Vararia minispora EC-137]|uniref:Ribosomal protein S5 domain 2-type protein n=1 Tax=Vararia minispora EC-137 TaxID=1314806 RepID=A0ACB8QSZ1_9AGAM|nr:ribosomal protein S5 domain 2-type protein [Vararia minispora EC-137]
MRPPSPSINEKEFLFASLEQALRIDGRALFEQREPELVFGDELGSVECSLGKTRVLAIVEGKMIRPNSDRPFEGTITIHSEISPMASVEYESGRPSEEEGMLSRMLDKVIRRSDVVDKEALCVRAGERVWHIRLTIHCLADAGNLIDCACMAGVVALKHFRRPEVEIVGDEVTIHPPESRAPVPLTLRHLPFVLTFAYFSRGAVLPSAASTASDTIIALLDPNLLEQRLSSGTLALALNAQRELCVVQKAGGVPLEPGEVTRAIEIAVPRAKQLEAFVEARVKDDWERRRVEVR